MLHLHLHFSPLVHSLLVLTQLVLEGGVLQQILLGEGGACASHGLYVERHHSLWVAHQWRADRGLGGAEGRHPTRIASLFDAERKLRPHLHAACTHAWFAGTVLMMV